ncbi:hypothetical protein [Aquabacterium sp.]|uniref:LVIVD repeat-containing protein n=1 Tax=Aquabacterium sp. TaxID=1872578 RepID=UPI0024874ED1|nr:hypothetical protein [Aquabacterium sp.]MDI1257746.1 hypothetical protein [Aquabacterium sp.]
MITLLQRWYSSPTLQLTAAMLAVLYCLTCAAVAAEDHATDVNIAVPPALCGPGSRPETGLQGQVPLQDRLNGRSRQGYACNLELVGQYQGEGSATISAVGGHCAYMATSYAGRALKKSPGVQVIDVSDPSKPSLVRALATRAFEYGTWESLKVNDAGTMLAGAGVGGGLGVGKLDLYDITDCANPKLLNSSAQGDSLPVNNIAHEGEWSPDGRTYWTSGLAAGALTAIDVNNPTKPRTIYFGGSTIFVNHGMSFNADGTRLYMASIFPAGIVILDVSDIQNRKASAPRVRQIAKVTWKDGSTTQRAVPATIKGRPYLIAIDELGAEKSGGGIRFIDISDERNPIIVSHIRLAIQLKENFETTKQDSAGNGIFKYDAHYCALDRQVEPTALACGYFQSGIRVFDIRDPFKPKEIAYFNPPAQTGKNALLPGSDHAGSPVFGSILGNRITDPALLQVQASKSKLPDLTADWCSSAPQFVNGQLWTTCNDNGFMVLKFTNGIYPLTR